MACKGLNIDFRGALSLDSRPNFSFYIGPSENYRPGINCMLKNMLPSLMKFYELFSYTNQLAEKCHSSMNDTILSGNDCHTGKCILS